MVATTNNTDISYSREVVAGIINTNPVFKTIPTTGGSPTNNITTAVSEVIRSDRQTTDLTKTDVDINGDINYELDYPNYAPLMVSLMQDGTVQAEFSVGSFLVTGTAAGDGIVGLSIDAVQYDITPTASDTATVMATALTAEINSGSTHVASNAAGVITITSVYSGVAGDSVVFTDATTDTGTTGVPTQPTGGVDQVQNGYSIIGVTINTGSSLLTKAGIEGLVEVGDVFYMSSATNPDNDMARVITDISIPDQISFSPVVPVGTTDGSTDIVMKLTDKHTNSSDCDVDKYTIRKRVAPCPSGQYDFFYKGCSINTMNWSLSTGSILNGTFGVMGYKEQVETSNLPGMTVIDVTPYTIMNSISSVAAINIEGVNLGTCKFTSMDLTYDNQVNLAKSLGIEGACDSASFSLMVTGNVEVYFANLDVYNAFINSTGFGVTLILQDPDGNVIGMNMPYCKFESLDVAISSNDSFLTQSGSFRALMDPDLGYTFKLSLIDA